MIYNSIWKNIPVKGPVYSSPMLLFFLENVSILADDVLTI